MNKEELNNSLQFIVEEEKSSAVEIVMYAILKNKKDPLKLDIKPEDSAEIAKMFVKSIKNNIIQEEDYSVLSLSSADERKNCFYEYDLELPEELTLLEKVIGNDNLKTFDFRKNEFSEIDSLIIVLGIGDKKVSIYKKLSPVEVIGRGGYIFGIVKSKKRLERFDEQLLRITSKFQVIRIDEKVIILDLKTIEKSFGFHDVIKREAVLGLSAINKMNIISDIESLKEMIDDVTFARKLTKVAKYSPVIKLQIANADIIAFAKKHPATSKMKYSDDGKKFNLTSKMLKNLFVKILNDDLLTSELTKLHYESLAKDGLETIEDNP
ncbi:anti-phage protein KwaB [Ornithobacterium rhinotracheale]